MVTPHGEPWTVLEDGHEPGVYDCNGKQMFNIELHYGNITLDEFKRMVHAFNACAGIPDSVLEKGNIWQQGYDVGYEKGYNAGEL